jgi:surface antigen
MRVNVGEDYSWCGRAQQAGYQIKVDPTVGLGHHKEIVYYA